ncbi:MAG: hypothetical protein KC593_17255 [Myxococcales bacterium]|nr:hypothetical protein [Myxococcales bacterium]
MEPTPDPDEAATDAAPNEVWGPSDWVLRVVLPVLVAVLFIGVLLYERGAHDVDLRVFAPAEVAPGDRIPLRAFVLEGVGTAELPRIVSHPIAVDDAAFDDEQHRGAPLTESEVAGAEGSFTASAAVGEQRLYFVATLPDGEQARVQRRVQVTATPAASDLVPRVTTSAREYQLGPLRTEPDAPPGLVLDARVPGGVCVPEVPCELLVWMGRPTTALLSLEPTEGVTVTEEATLTAALTRLVLVVRRLEATVTLRASVDGRVVARRALQLPVSPGGLSASVDRSIVPAGESVRVRVDGVAGPTAAVINVFRGGHWVAATSIAGDEQAPADGLTLPPLAPGLHLVQAQATPFDVQGSGVAVVCAYPAGDSAEACLLALAGDTRVRARQDAFAERLRSGEDSPETSLDPQLAFRFMAHDHARDLYGLPFPSSGLEQVAYGVDERVSGSRVVVALAMLLMGLVAASIVLRRAREGANLADAVLREAGSAEDERDVTRARSSRTTWLAALLVLGAFVLVAIMVLSRGM